MTTNCKNCETAFEGNFCNNCGQSANTHDINWHYAWHDIQHGIFHVDKGLLYTMGQLYSRPGAAIREFIEGKRVKHFKPIGMIFLLGTFYGIFYHYLGIDLFKMGAKGNDPELVKLFKHLNEWVGSHYAIISLASVPLFSVGSYLVFRKSRYNMIEHIVLNSFIAAQKFVVQFALLSLIYFFQDSPKMAVITTLGVLADFGLTLWVYSSFFTGYRKFSRFLRAILVYIIFFALEIIIMILGVIIWLLIRKYS
jgi:hypothetical protein